MEGLVDISPTEPVVMEKHARLGYALRAARCEAKLTQAEFAGLIGIAASTLCRIELGQRQMPASWTGKLAKMTYTDGTAAFDARLFATMWLRLYEPELADVLLGPEVTF